MNSLTTKKTSSSSVLVAVRVRPFSVKEKDELRKVFNSKSHFASQGNLSSSRKSPGSLGIKRVVHAVDDHVLSFDPPEEFSSSQGYANKNSSVNSFRKNSKHRDLKFAFDYVFDESSTQQDVFEGTSQSLIDEVLNGFNASVFAYGATGCGKTHTISGTSENPGIIFLTMAELFERIKQEKEEKKIEASMSYLEVYNETLRDLLSEDSQKTSLNLREDAKLGVVVSGLSEHYPDSIEQMMDLITKGNKNRTVCPTEANATSSRSHAILQVNIKQCPRTSDFSTQYTVATLSFIDLAGSERASATKNRSARMVEGANINKSLLALGNCINALCDDSKKQHIPYRNSKLTRLLKFSLGGNCKTVMITCVSPSNAYYEETLNTLKYADRAKNIKTRIAKNTLSVNMHVSQYTSAIKNLKKEVQELKAKLEDGNKKNQEMSTTSTNHQTNSSQIELLVEVREKVRLSLEKVQSKELALKKKTFMIESVVARLNLLKTWLLYSSPESAPGHVKAYQTNVSNLITQLESKRLSLERDSSFIEESLNRTKETESAYIHNLVETTKTKIGPLLMHLVDQDKVLVERDFENDFLSFAAQGTADALNNNHLLLSSFLALNATTLLGSKDFIQGCEDKGINSTFLNDLLMQSISAFTLASTELQKLPNVPSLPTTPVKKLTPQSSNKPGSASLNLRQGPSSSLRFPPPSSSQKPLPKRDQVGEEKETEKKLLPPRILQVSSAKRTAQVSPGKKIKQPSLANQGGQPSPKKAVQKVQTKVALPVSPSKRKAQSTLDRPIVQKPVPNDRLNPIPATKDTPSTQANSRSPLRVFSPHPATALPTKSALAPRNRTLKPKKTVRIDAVSPKTSSVVNSRPSKPKKIPAGHRLKIALINSGMLELHASLYPQSRFSQSLTSNQPLPPASTPISSQPSQTTPVATVSRPSTLPPSPNSSRRRQIATRNLTPYVRTNRPAPTDPRQSFTPSFSRPTQASANARSNRPIQSSNSPSIRSRAKESSSLDSAKPLSTTSHLPAPTPSAKVSPRSTASRSRATLTGPQSHP